MAAGVAQPKHRYIVLDSLRGISACIVVLYHVLDDVSGLSVPFIRHGGLFVDFFFVLSGFVIGSSYGQRLAEGYSVGAYMIQRFFRIYPLHFFMLLAFLAFEIVFALFAPGAAARQPFEGVYSVPELLSSLFLVQIFYGPDILPWNGPSWSIAAEFWTYLIFAVAIRLRPKWIVPLCVATALLAPLYLGYLTDRNIGVFHDGALVRCLFGFAMGVLCWKLPDAIRERALPAWADQLLELGAVALTVTFVALVGIDRLSLAAPFVFACAVAIFSRQRGAISRILQLQPFVIVGNLSYSIYMIHWFLLWRYLNVMGVVERLTGLNLVATGNGHTGLTGGPLVQGISTAIFLVGVLVTAHITYTLIEQPGRKLGQMIVRRQAKPAALPASA